MELWDLAFHRYSDGRYHPSIDFDGSGRCAPETCLTVLHRLISDNDGLHEKSHWVRINWQVY